VGDERHKKLYAGWDFNLETQYLLHYNNMHNFNHNGNETSIQVLYKCEKGFTLFPVVAVLLLVQMIAVLQ